jgi:hypothetical protein
MSYANITNPANFQLQDFAQFGFRVITTDFIPVPGEQYRTLYVLQDAVVTATTQKGDDITSKAILAGTLLHGLFNSVSITSGRVLAYAAGRVTAEEIIALYEAYVVALGGTLENTQCAIDTINEEGVDLFADASLVMIPEGYGTGVVYGQRPLTSDSQLTFTRASTATRVGPDGAIAVVGSNVPRIDYTGGGCGKLLLEPQRTNLYNYSEQLNQWTATNATVTANYAVSPDGYTNADRVQFTAGGLLYVSGTGSAGENTLSVYAKATNGTSAKFRLFGNGNTTNSSDQTATSEWQRFTFTYTYSASSAGLKVATTGADDVIFYGFQHEIGAYATSYIPTTAAAVTRLADACSKTGISSLIGQTQGTLFLEYPNFKALEDTGLIGIDDGSANNRVLIFGNGTNGITGQVLRSGTTTNITPFAVSGNVKVAIAYSATEFVFFVNGAVRFTGGAVVFSNTMSVFTFNHVNLTGSRTSQALLFKTRLTNEQLQTLTSL